MQRLIIMFLVVFTVNTVRAELPAKPGFYVDGRHLYTPDGNPVILRGVNRMFIWIDKQGKAIPEIAKTGANSLRIVWATNGTAAELEHLISETLKHGMIPMVELHDATGKWDKLPLMVDYWVQPEIVKLIKKYEKFLLVNIANEAGKDVNDGAEFLRAYSEAITRMRTAGIRTPLVIDADGYGNNPTNLFGQGHALIQHDPEHNILLSLHTYWPYAWHDTQTSGYATVEARITGTLQRAIEEDLPLIIGEFAHVGPTKTCDLPFPYQHLINEADRLSFSWLAWSWGPGNSDCKDMDMTPTGTFAGLDDWGLEVAVSHPKSIKNTSWRPSIILKASTP